MIASSSQTTTSSGPNRAGHGGAYDAVVVGGGFFGLYLAEQLALRRARVLLCEQDAAPMQRASYNNQARVHNGYHYPRSILTAFRSRVNYPRFVAEFPACIDASFTKVYAIGRQFSRVSADQFRLFMERIGAPTEPAPATIARLFRDDMIEEVFLVEECAFDAVVLARLMRERALRAGVELRCDTQVTAIATGSGTPLVATLRHAGATRQVAAGMVFNCTYSHINRLISASGLATIPLKHELTEMCLLEVPPELAGLGITVMCGPFFSCMPFPPRGLHTLSHVRYTPHCHWYDGGGQDGGGRDGGGRDGDGHDGGGPYRAAETMVSQVPRRSAYSHMLRDAQRYLPALAGARYRGSLWEVKTLLPRSEVDDGRPILFKRDYGLPGHHVIMGGKIDNVYDVAVEVDKLLSEQRG